jgi:hypothetical protein
MRLFHRAGWQVALCKLACKSHMMAGFDTLQTPEGNERDGSVQGRNIVRIRSAIKHHALKSAVPGPVCCQPECCRTDAFVCMRVMTAGNGTALKTC